ncbi:hypothetical protein JCGZ_22616 [Jatropha curcas]|uniref:Uncharacterized protein n=1 Tax=Jatropha curcas TaxID=180498 RepID=A0A067JM67_JATCU|nr:transcription termination factor MTERF9, chloroplastic [Jatropha curcas]KDP25081.1 hypothetical protein JCGZ_22616 [Jatropha curcas]
MKPNPNSLINFCSLFITSQRFFCLHRRPSAKSPFFFISTTTASYSTIGLNQVENVLEGEERAEESVEVLRKWGCSENDLSKILTRRPSLRKSDPTHLQSKLSLLQDLGITSADLVKIINCRPRFLSCRINRFFEERLEYFMTLFGSREVLLKAIIRNPSLLTYDFHNSIKPAIALYEGIGVSKKDLIPMLLSRPTLIPRTTFDDEKMECIQKAGIPKNSKMYKYIVTLVGVSRIETIRKKVANFEKYGLSDEEIWSLFGRSPYLLTLSVDKVQRNMTFIMGTMKLPAKMVIEYPYLLLCNLEIVLKPRWFLAGKLQDLNLCPQIKGPLMLRALRMKERRFLKVFVWCHPKDVAEELMEFYKMTKGVKRLAEASKKSLHQGFPF